MRTWLSVFCLCGAVFQPICCSFSKAGASSGGAKPETDWQLTASRADSSRRVLQGAGVDADRVYQVSGKASSEPLYPDDPTLPGNRRIAIVLLREAPVLPPNPGL